MLIVCPSCASHYELDAAKLGPAGRKVRCAACKTSWHVPPEPEPFPDAPSADETMALLDEELRRAAEIDREVTALAGSQSEDREPQPVPPARKRLGGRKGKAQETPPRSPFGRIGAPAALALGGVALLCLAVWQRDLTVRAAPQLAAVFDRLGLPVNLRGLSLTAIESGLIQDGQGRFLVVEGDVTNITRGTTKVPLIEVAVKDAAGETLYTWTTEPPRASLEPFELMRFRARLGAPPETGRSVQVRFFSVAPTGLASAR